MKFERKLLEVLLREMLLERQTDKHTDGQRDRHGTLIELLAPANDTVCMCLLKSDLKLVALTLHVCVPTIHNAVNTQSSYTHISNT